MNNPMLAISSSNHGYVRLVEFALKNKEFSVDQACKATGLSESEFSGAKYSLFLLRGEHESVVDQAKPLEWRLKPEAYFGYLSYLELNHSLSASRKAWWFSIVSLVVASVSLFVTAYGVFFK
jgi:hypothetical protein